jgi:hypothetical protein
MKTRHKSLPLNLNEPFPLVLVVSLWYGFHAEIATKT